MPDPATDIDACGIAQRDTVEHHLLGNHPLVRPLQRRELCTVVDSLGLDWRRRLTHLNIEPVTNRHAQHIGEVVLALGVAVRQSVQPASQALTRYTDDPGVDLVDGPFFRVRVLLLDDALHPPALVAHDPSVAGRIGQRHRQQTEPLMARRFDQVT